VQVPSGYGWVAVVVVVVVVVVVAIVGAARRRRRRRRSGRGKTGGSGGGGGGAPRRRRINLASTGRTAPLNESSGVGGVDEGHAIVVVSAVRRMGGVPGG
jgi:hypothetical protein